MEKDIRTNICIWHSSSLFKKWPSYLFLRMTFRSMEIFVRFLKSYSHGFFFVKSLCQHQWNVSSYWIFILLQHGFRCLFQGLGDFFSKIEKKYQDEKGFWCFLQVRGSWFLVFKAFLGWYIDVTRVEWSMELNSKWVFVTAHSEWGVKFYSLSFSNEKFRCSQWEFHKCAAIPSKKDVFLDFLRNFS